MNDIIDTTNIEKVSKMLVCSLSISSDHPHFSRDSIQLKCGANACKNCIEKSVICSKCEQTHKPDEDYLSSKSVIEFVAESAKNALIKIMRDQAKAICDSRECKLNDHFQYLTEIINAKYECRKRELESAYKQTLRQLEGIKRMSFQEAYKGESHLNLKRFLLDSTADDVFLYESKLIELRNKENDLLNIIYENCFDLSQFPIDMSIMGEFKSAAKFLETTDITYTKTDEIKGEMLLNSLRNEQALSRSETNNENIDEEIDVEDLVIRFRNELKKHNLDWYEFHKYYFKDRSMFLTKTLFGKPVLTWNEISPSIQNKLKFINEWLADEDKIEMFKKIYKASVKKNTKTQKKVVNANTEKNKPTKVIESKYTKLINFENTSNDDESISITDLSKRLFVLLDTNKISKESFAYKVLNCTKQVFIKIMDNNIPKEKVASWQVYYKLINTWINDTNRMKVFERHRSTTKTTTSNNNKNKNNKLTTTNPEKIEQDQPKDK